MINNKIEKTIESIFTKNRKCIINTDLDGILSGMILQHYLNWDIIGYSSCAGKIEDELWLKEGINEISDAVFVDLLVCVEDYTVIDQHFISPDEESINEYINHNNKINPNIMRGKAFLGSDNKYHYTEKYPFGTVHFVICMLEKLNIIDDKEMFDYNKILGGLFNKYDLSDLILRADRVIGNTNLYTSNCINWAKWIIDIGGLNTKILFNKVIDEYPQRSLRESNVEQDLLSFGCKGKDGECSNLFINRDYDKITKFFSFLEDALNIPSLPVFKVNDFNKLIGKRFNINRFRFELTKKELENDQLFSYAFVSMNQLSVTYMEEK